MTDWFAHFLVWLGFNEPKSLVQERRVNRAVAQRKEACLRLDRAIREVVQK